MITRLSKNNLCDLSDVHDITRLDTRHRRYETPDGVGNGFAAVSRGYRMPELRAIRHMEVTVALPGLSCVTRERVPVRQLEFPSWGLCLLTHRRRIPWPASRGEQHKLGSEHKAVLCVVFTNQVLAEVT